MEKRSWNGFNITVTSVLGKPQLNVDRYCQLAEIDAVVTARFGRRWFNRSHKFRKGPCLRLPIHREDLDYVSSQARLMQDAVSCVIENFDYLKGEGNYVTAESLEKLEQIGAALPGLQNALEEVLQENGRIVRVERSISERWAYISLPVGGAIYCIPKVKRIAVYGASLEELESWINS